MKSNNLVVTLGRVLMMWVVLFSADRASALSKINETPMSTDQLYQTAANGRVVYIDNTGRLFSVNTDGTDRKNLGEQKPNESENERLLLVAKQASEFAIVSATGATPVVYFQARENPRSFRLFLYKVDVLGSMPPQKLFQLVKPLKQLIVSPDSAQLYLAGDDKHSVLNLASGEKLDLPIKPVPAAAVRLSADFKWVLFVSEFRVASQRTFELHAYNLVDATSRTLLQGMDRYEFNFEISSDSSTVAVQEIVQGAERLVALSFEGSDVMSVFPSPGETIRYRIEQIRFMPGIRGDGDTGALIFSARNDNEMKQIYIADLIDLSPRTLEPSLNYGENIVQFRLSPDSRTLIFQRESYDQGPGVTPHPRTYALNLVDPAARPVFLFENAYQHSEFLADSSGLVFVSSGGFYPRNEIVEVSLDGKSSHLLSASFPANWIASNEQISKLGVGPGKTLFVSIYNPLTSPVKYTIQSFESN